MRNSIRLSGIILFMAVLQSCSKKVQPSRTPPETNDTRTDTVSVSLNPDSVTTITKTDSVVEKKKVVKYKPKTTTPQLITVNDQYAKKSVDGRLYYDLQGHRYWKNYKDGKYYIFNKSMLKDENFKAPK